MKTAINQPTVDNVPTSASFVDELKTKICRIVGSSAVSLRQLALQMEGAYPTDILDAIRLLRADGVEVPILEELIDKRSSSSNGLIETADIPEPHPLDYDWRFTNDTLKVLSQELADMKSERIAILGAPTLFLDLARANAQVYLYDKNAHLIETLHSLGLSSAIYCDLFESHFKQPSFDTVVADPPWYPEHYGCFIRNSAELLLPDGVLLLSVLPRLTRPSAVQDRMAILRDAQECGLEIVDIRPSRLAYDSPAFEQASLRAEDIPLRDWRRGDLFIFRRNTLACQPKSDGFVEEDSQWASFSVGKTIVKVKCRDSTSASVEFRALSPTGDVHLHSVSRRAPFRSQIDVWNSRNLALWLSRPDYLCDILEHQKRGGTFEEAISQIVTENGLSGESRNALTEVVNLLVEDAREVDNA
jgi:hypothetical protein